MQFLGSFQETCDTKLIYYCNFHLLKFSLQNFSSKGFFKIPELCSWERSIFVVTQFLQEFQHCLWLLVFLCSSPAQARGKDMNFYQWTCAPLEVEMLPFWSLLKIISFDRMLPVGVADFFVYLYIARFDSYCQRYILKVFKNCYWKFVFTTIQVLVSTPVSTIRIERFFQFKTTVHENEKWLILRITITWHRTFLYRGLNSLLHNTTISFSSWVKSLISL